MDAKDSLTIWQANCQKNIFTTDSDYQHSIQFYADHLRDTTVADLTQFGEIVAAQLEPLVSENNLAYNLPTLSAYDEVGHRIDKVIHHPSYVQAGNLIYQTQLLSRMQKPGGLLDCLSLLFLSAQTGEAGHNCPIACSAGIIRVLSMLDDDFPDKQYFLNQLTTAKFTDNFTGAQFLTEIQGGSDVGLNATQAVKESEQVWRITGEKWFCSNAGADLFFVTARYQADSTGTKGLGLFLIPAQWQKQQNHFQIRRLKNKIGTRTMATGEIDFTGAYAYPMGKLADSFRLVMDNVLHLSRIFNAICVLGMARRAYYLARTYAQQRLAFGHTIIQYPLVQEQLAQVKAENTAMLAAVFATIALQDQHDVAQCKDEKQGLLLRTLVNLLKYFTAYHSVRHIHAMLSVLAGNGTIETFSPIPRLLRDAIVCENWEGTHNVLQMQILRDIHRYHVDAIFIEFVNTKLDSVSATNQFKETISQHIVKLQHDLEKMKHAQDHVQTVLMRDIIDEMAIILSSVFLLLEAIDAQQQGQASKVNCLTYFCLLHLNENKVNKNEDYLLLLSSLNDV